MTLALVAVLRVCWPSAFVIPSTAAWCFSPLGTVDAALEEGGAALPGLWMPPAPSPHDRCAARIQCHPPFPSRHRVQLRAGPVGHPAGAKPLLTAAILTATNAKELLAVLAPELEGELLDHIHISAAFTRLVRYKQSFNAELQRGPVVARLVDRTMGLLKRKAFPPKESANVMWAVASLGEAGHVLHELLPSLVKSCADQSSQLRAQEVANVIWAAATLELPDEDLRLLLPSLCDSVLDLATLFDAHSVANILWAAAQLKGRAPELLEIHGVLAQMVVDKRAALKPGEIAGIFRSATILKDDAPHFSEALPGLMMELGRIRPSFSPQDVADVVSSFPALKEQVPVLKEWLPDLLQEVPRVTKDLTFEAASRILLAGASLRGEHVKLWRPLVPKLSSALLQQLGSASGEAVANAVWALALLADNSAQREALEKLAQAATPMVGTMPSAHLAKACYGLALRGVHWKPFLDSASEAVRATAAKWDAQSKALILPDLAWSFAKLGIADGPLLKVVAENLTGLSAELTEWSLCALAFTADTFGSEFDPAFVQEVLDETKRRNLGPEAVAKSAVGVDDFQKWLQQQ